MPGWVTRSRPDAEQVVQDPAAEAGLADAAPAVDEEGNGGVVILPGLGEEVLDLKGGGVRAEVAAANEVGGADGNEFGGLLLRREWCWGGRLGFGLRMTH